MGETEVRSSGDERTLDRRTFVTRAAATTALAAVAVDQLTGDALAHGGSNRHIEEKTIAELQALMTSRRETARSLVEKYLERIEDLDQRGPKLNSVIEVNPDARAIAKDARPRAQGGQRPRPAARHPDRDQGQHRHGRPRCRRPPARSRCVGAPAAQDSTVAAKLREAGAIILGKANLSEWANFRGFYSSSGWSGRGGQCRNPYVLDRNPCGSSSGSGVAARPTCARRRSGPRPTARSCARRTRAASWASSRPSG